MHLFEIDAATSTIERLHRFINICQRNGLAPTDPIPHAPVQVLNALRTTFGLVFEHIESTNTYQLNTQSTMHHPRRIEVLSLLCQHLSLPAQGSVAVWTMQTDGATFQRVYGVLTPNGYYEQAHHSALLEAKGKAHAFSLNVTDLHEAWNLIHNQYSQYYANLGQPVHLIGNRQHLTMVIGSLALTFVVTEEGVVTLQRVYAGDRFDPHRSSVLETLALYVLNQTALIHWDSPNEQWTSSVYYGEYRDGLLR